MFLVYVRLEDIGAVLQIGAFFIRLKVTFTLEVYIENHAYTLGVL